MKRHHTSLLASLKRFLTPQVWKQAHQAETRPKSPSRWGLHPLVMILLIMTWTNGDSEGERFATAGACYVAMHQHSRRPGKTLQGLEKALAKVPLGVLHALFAGVRQVLLSPLSTPLVHRSVCRFRLRRFASGVPTQC